MNERLKLWTICLAAAALFGCSEDSISSGNGSAIKTSEAVVVEGVQSTPLVTSEDGKSASVTVKLKQAPTGKVTVRMASDDPSEGILDKSEISFDEQNWETPQTVTMKGVDDDIIDGNINYHAMLIYVDAEGNTGDSYLIDMINEDNDTAGIVVESTGDSTKPGESAVISVTLSSQPDAAVTVTVVSDNPEAGTVDVTTLTFTPDNWNQPQNVTVTGGEVTGSYNVTISSSDTDDEHYKAEISETLSFVNHEADVKPGVNVQPEGTITVEENGSGEITVSLTTKPTSDVTITFESSNPDEGTVDVTTITFTPDNWDQPQTVTVSGVVDGLFDGDSDYTIIGKIDSEDPDYAGEEIVVNVVGKDTTEAALVVSPNKDLITSEDGLEAQFTVALSAKPSADVGVSFASNNLAEGETDVTQLTFNADNWNVPQTVTIKGLDDSVKDGDVPYSIQFDALVSDDAHFNGIVPDPITVTNVDNDTAGIFVSPSSVETSESGDTAEVSFILRTQPTAEVTLTLTVSDDTEGKLDKNIIKFDSGNWNVAQTVILSGLDDDLVDGDVAYSVALSTESSDANYNALSIDPVSATNKDNDSAGVVWADTTDIVTSEDGSEKTYHIVLTAQPTSNVSVSVKSLDSSEGEVVSAEFEFTSDNWNVAQELKIKGVDDSVADGDIAYELLATMTSEDLAFNEQSFKLNAVNLDNDKAIVVTSPDTVYLSNGQTSTTVTVSLSTQPVGEVTIPLESADPSLYGLSTSSLTFNEENWNQPQMVTVSLIGSAASTTEPVNSSIVIGSVQNVGAAYDGVDPADIPVVVTKFETLNYAYKGAPEEVTLYPGKYKLEVWGASGGDDSNNNMSRPSHGGLGGYASGILTLDKPVKTYVTVGGKGAAGVFGYCSGYGCDGSYCKSGCSHATNWQNILGPGKGGGYNGGGSSTAWWDGQTNIGYGGGGATDVRLTTDSLYARVIVAGGGGGGDNGGGTYNGGDDGRGGYGGGESAGCGYVNGSLACTIGAPGYNTSTMPNNYTANHQVTLTHGFSFGLGQHARYANDEGGGGGGWFGGFSGEQNNAGGTGGSGWVYTEDAIEKGYTDAELIGGAWLLDSRYCLTEPQNIAGNVAFSSPTGAAETGHSGNGYARISLVSE